MTTDRSHNRKSTEAIGDELRELSAKMLHLSSQLDVGYPLKPSKGADSTIDAEIDKLNHILKLRRARKNFFDEALFADPAWDIMLDAALSQLRQIRSTVSDLCVASEVPPTTALRWIATLEKKGILQRTPDRLDGRRFFISLTDMAMNGMKDYLRSIPSPIDDGS